MIETTAYDIADVVTGKIKDRKGHRASKKVVETLRKAGVVSFSCGGKLNWKVVEIDAQSLFKRLGGSERV